MRLPRPPVPLPLRDGNRPDKFPHLALRFTRDIPVIFLSSKIVCSAESRMGQKHPDMQDQIPINNPLILEENKVRNDLCRPPWTLMESGDEDLLKSSSSLLASSPLIDAGPLLLAAKPDDGTSMLALSRMVSLHTAPLML